MTRIREPETLAECDRQLLRAHQQFLRADGRDDLGEATELWLRLEHLYDLRAVLPPPRLPYDDHPRPSIRPAGTPY